MLQLDINNVVLWAESNKLDLNIDKCHVLTFTRSNSPNLPNYNINNNKIINVFSTCDLGVIFDSRLTYTDQISKDVTSAANALGCLLRYSKHFRNESTFIALYNSLVLFRLRYISLVWNPLFEKYKSELKKVQKRFLKFLAFKADGVYPPQGSDYIQLCRRFHFPTLECKRIFDAVLFLFKILSSQLYAPELLLLIPFRIPRIQLRHDVPRYHVPFYLDVPKRSFGNVAPIYFACDHVNKLVAELNPNLDLFFSSKNTFISTLNNYIEKLFNID